MALLDICVTEGDDSITQEESRGNIGVITDMEIDYTDSMVSEIPSGGSDEVWF